MGQSRYERLPKTQNWQNVVALLAAPETSVAQVASGAAKACRGALRRHSDDPVVIWSIYLLALLPQAARRGEAKRFLEQAGIPQSALASPNHLLDEITTFLQKRNFENPEPSFLTETAALAFQQTFTKLLSEANLDLFTDASGQTEQALANYGTQGGFARASRYFFTSLMVRVLSYFLTKESVNAVGARERFESLELYETFWIDLRRYCWESSAIIEEFAEDWYSKYKWQGKLDVPHFSRFVWNALRKFSAEIGREHGET